MTAGAWPEGGLSQPHNRRVTDIIRPMLPPSDPCRVTNLLKAD